MPLAPIYFVNEARSKDIPNCKSPHGFTLTEILVVIAIITVLATAALSLFSRIREANRANTCRDTLKQLALAVQLYTQDADGTFPNGRWKYQIRPYFKEPGEFRCPTNSNLLARDLKTDVATLPLTERFATGYWYNGVDLSPFEHIGSGSSIESRAKRESTLPTPSTTWLMRDDQPSNGDTPGGGGGILAYSQCDENSRGNGATLHSGGANVSFLDGHVKWMTPETFYTTTCPINSGQNLR